MNMQSLDEEMPVYELKETHIFAAIRHAIGSRLFCMRAKQACFEALTVQTICVGFCIVCFLISIQYTVWLVLFCSLVAGTWFAARWRLRPASRTLWRQILLEVVVSSLLVLELCSCNLLLILISKLLGNNEYVNYAIISFLFAFLLVFCLLISRMVIYGLHFWNRLRRSHLRWSLTHAHLMVVLICAGAIALLGTMAILALSSGQPYSRNTIVEFFVFIFILLSLTCSVVLCVLPISAIFSFFSTRRLTGRIEKLTAATSTVRGGDYGVRIAVDGEDEIAHLQSDFNAMAVDLERTMGELKEERDHVATLLNARRELIANISHDLRTPVATVRSYLESTLVAWQCGQPPATLHQDMQIMEQQVTRLKTMINDLFTLSRAEVGHLEMRCVPTNVEQVVRRVVDAVAPMAWRASRVEVLTEYDLVEPSFPLALVDGNRLEQILHNLMHNAIRHTPPGGIIVIGLKAEGEQVAIQVKDTGEGIAADELPLIWERFYRARNVHTRPENGTGLGLAIVKELTESMGGTISVDSIVGRGACFTVRFSLAPDPTQLRTAPLSASVRQ